MINKGYRAIFIGLLSMIIASAMFYLDTSPSVAYTLLVIGFLLVGIGILLGFIKLVSDD
jgi:hypothetical protein